MLQESPFFHLLRQKVPSAPQNKKGTARYLSAEHPFQHLGGLQATSIPSATQVFFHISEFYLL